MLNQAPTPYPVSRPPLFLVRETLPWQEAHRELSRLARARASLDHDEGRWLLRAWRSRVDRHLGFGSFAEYIERLFGYKPRWTHERLRVAEALEHLPEMAQALRDGALTWSAVRELTRVATPDSEPRWLEVARGETVRQIEARVAGLAMGDEPDAAADPGRVKHVLRFEVTGETLATFREAMVKLRRDAGGAVDDDDALLLLARQVLGGPADAGRASYQVAVTLCERCGRGRQQGGGEATEVAPEVVAMVACDAQHIGAQARATQDVTPAVRRAVLARDHGQCTVPGCAHTSYLDIHHLVPRAEGGAHHPEQLVTLCTAHHRAHHRGHLRIEGPTATAKSYRRADGSAYGAGIAALDPSSIDVRAQAFRALCSLGFRETETRRALNDIEAPAHVGDEGVVQLIRAALAALSVSRRH